MKAIIIGATSGIGRELAKQMSVYGYVVGITGRRSELLDSLEEELPGECFKTTMDLAEISEAVKAFKELLREMDDVSVVVINSGTGNVDPTFPLSGELETVAVNVAGFTALANVAYHYFANKKEGHIVATSSIMALRGGPCPSYNASKAYMSNYLEGVLCRSRMEGHNIVVTDVRPGFVDTAMAKGEGIFWMAPVEKAARQIFKAIKKRRRIVYITKRWRLVGFLVSCMPFKLYLKVIS
ncbi:hypothetical protein BZJ17_05045 [Salinivibrio sp. IB574]|uniref:SDR family NAD(P)-dependent oxidoreductase n=1 Tax=Salinivibrio sp. IB574 TaxID=1909444 RepID=UPI0009892DAD|nr:SDR family NAD(P)-dependent oxidoreductase [Salinivibrio sp. IB574]OOF22888.1 hypothetical protein BZJ17_05045 [Salinivibrio sp. IB574]